MTIRLDDVANSDKIKSMALHDGYEVLVETIKRAIILEAGTPVSVWKMFKVVYRQGVMNGMCRILEVLEAIQTSQRLEDEDEEENENAKAG